ncbi:MULTISPECIES: alpha/beta hydrolase family protein [Streptomyces]|jgi:predicted dienelactone hydrolase|uniref:alpha/beta hydrolase family protein n=1 Tax=unclassified Streptomyces TaxID=2593676 RepID=UPI00088CC5FB|nr:MULTISPECIES: alpha/beta fold hydrolase [unclassified Streptomyces]MDX2731908.1 alpha/beta fold hydrolase [Streptomyces sp. PA03-2a]MDX3768794.1 alpha/beta fold hydrolase [Streptomyces sp. AK08-01B]MDX3815286.1 alpha/beta fold hydrolase [Streptomyces sp. AK08-01A]SCX88988.1 Alpha/beta hydrolase family protein [Streptomyces sp. 136MFCol5.1]
MPDSKTANAPKTAGAPTTVLSAKPVVLSAPGRGEDLQIRVSAPATGGDLPVVVFSHGFGWSMNGYAPLADFWAAHGFVVLQPTHLDSRTLGLAAEDPRTPRIWRFRIEDLTRALDGLDTLEASVPGLAGRLDHDRIAVAGHSWGAQTASTLLGARVLDSDGVPGEDMSDARIKAGVLLALTGLGDDLTPFAAENFPFMRPSFDRMTTSALIVAGDNDQSPLSTRGPDWFTDPFTCSPGDKSLLTLFEAEHSLGGIAGYEVAETTDESPARVALIQQLTTVFLRSVLYPEDTGWRAAAAALEEEPNPLGKLQSR